VVARYTTPPIFHNRQQAGVALAGRLQQYANRGDVVVLGLPRGGLPVADEVARALDAPLDVFVVRKLGVPGHSELAMGAIAAGGVQVLNEDVVKWYGLSLATIDLVARAEQAELERRERAYRNGRSPVAIEGRVALIVDDGLATGSTMRAAVRALRQLKPSRVVVAVPVGAPDTCRDLETTADEVVCLATPDPFDAVGLWYEDFSQTTDEEVCSILAASTARATGKRGA
jgi:predicted phosphoribosyltransferase